MVYLVTMEDIDGLKVTTIVENTQSLARFIANLDDKYKLVSIEPQRNFILDNTQFRKTDDNLEIGGSSK